MSDEQLLTVQTSLQMLLSLTLLRCNIKCQQTSHTWRAKSFVDSGSISSVAVLLTCGVDGVLEWSCEKKEMLLNETFQALGCFDTWFNWLVQTQVAGLF